MIDLRHRETRALELMDDPDCDPDALDRTYGHFGLVNRLVSGWRSVYETKILPLLPEGGEPLTLLDVGSGGGDVARSLASWAARDGRRLVVTGVDPDERAHEFAGSQRRVAGLSFERATSADLVARGRRFDVVISNHVLHHLDDPSLDGLLRDSRTLAGRLVVHSDIARGRIAYCAYSIATRRGFGGSFIHDDGLTSIRRSYRPSELRARLPEGWRVETPGAFRVLAVFRPSSAEAPVDA